MKRNPVFCLIVSFALWSAAIHAQATNDATATDGVFDQLVEVTNFLDNYRNMAAVAAEVSAARGKGNDAEFAKLMTSVARHGISDVKGCVARGFSGAPMTPEDAANLIKTLKTPMGQKTLEIGQAMLINDVRHGSPQGPDPAFVSALSDRERQELISIREQPSFVHYGQLLASAGFKRNIGQCLMASKAFRESGVKL